MAMEIARRVCVAVISTPSPFNSGYKKGTIYMARETARVVDQGVTRKSDLSENGPGPVFGQPPDFSP